MLVCKVMLSEDHELTHDIRLELNAVKRCLLSIMRKEEIAVCALVCAPEMKKQCDFEHFIKTGEKKHQRRIPLQQYTRAGINLS